MMIWNLTTLSNRQFLRSLKRARFQAWQQWRRDKTDAALLTYEHWAEKVRLFRITVYCGPGQVENDGR